MEKIVDPQTTFRSLPEAVADFLECYPFAQTAKDKLWELLLAAMGSKHADMWDAHTRATMLFFFEQCCGVFDTIYDSMQPPKLRPDVPSAT